MPSNFSPTFYIGSIRIGTVEGASSVNLGHNTNAGVKSEKKHNKVLDQLAEMEMSLSMLKPF
ncbi:hypothetical protein JCM9140_816 [Halalkalibacter wakoensis JCM 9140]|uniref:Uncharacterized protein n=1 Tax=Halalkalibacter wakoensis JCM 9140 TaxID=1236970 RepID=W4PYP8_9BACI|nr:hypothetical protein [Halalkalibacter wakoensis]GAE24857.1 hypothetical protein JCM9140_816 [Halalkalibacter wakoensis JCM 9140]